MPFEKRFSHFMLSPLRQPNPPAEYSRLQQDSGEMSRRELRSLRAGEVPTVQGYGGSRFTAALSEPSGPPGSLSYSMILTNTLF